MADVVKLTFNPFQENTYIVYDETKECIIFDPGCYHAHEKEELINTLQRLQLQPVRLINTHCHVDHVFGNLFISETYGLGLECHRGEVPVLEMVEQVCMMYQIPYPEKSPMPSTFIEAGDVIQFGNTSLEVRFTPGHSPASICFYNPIDQFVIAGDVLFKESVGRADLPGGDMDTLLNSIRTQLYTLDDAVIVYPGHGPHTTIGYEKRHNPFVR